MWRKKNVKSLSCVWLFVIPWTVAHQAPPSMEFSRQEHWSGLPFPSPRDLPDPGIEPESPALGADALPSEPPRKPRLRNVDRKKKRYLSFPPPWEFQTPVFSSRAPDPSFLLRDPRLLINLPRNWLSQSQDLIFKSSFRVHSKYWAEGPDISYILPFPRYPRPPPPSTSPTRWYTCYNWWTYIDTSRPSPVHSLPEGSLGAAPL